MNKKIIKCLAVMLILICTVQPVFAECWDYKHKADCNADSKCYWDGVACRDKSDWFGQAYNFFNFFSSGSTVDLSALDELVDMVKIVGNMIFVAATVILGVRYIWGSVESKASVKDSLITLVVAACMFYGFTTIESILNPKGLFAAHSVEKMAYQIYCTILYICNYLAIGGIIYIGVKYMLAGAEGRASLKAKGVPIVLGLVMVYATITFLNVIVTTLTEIGG